MSCRSLRKNINQSGPKVYRVDKSLDLYVNTCDNDYAKFMCCENDQYPICIANFWPCLFDYRSGESLEDVRRTKAARTIAQRKEVHSTHKFDGVCQHPNLSWLFTLDEMRGCHEGS